MLSAEEGAKIVAFLAARLPQRERWERLGEIVVQLPEGERDDALRHAYLEVEKQVLAQRESGWTDRHDIRKKIGDHFRLRRAMPSSFTVLFLSRTAQIFFAARFLLEALWERGGWEAGRKRRILLDVVEDAPLGKIHAFGKDEWRTAFAAFEGLAEQKREAELVDAFKRAIGRTYHELVLERGEDRARIVIEEAIRRLRDDLGTMEGLSGVLAVLPEGVLEEERIALAPREELAEAIARQTQEMKGKNIALVYEAKRLHETIRALEQAKAQAEAMASAQQEFITVVSHQFRTPLAAIRWEADAILDAARDRSEFDEARQIAGAVRERSLFLIGVLENIFDLLSIESGRYKISVKFGTLRDAVVEACNEFTREVRQRKVALRWEAQEEGRTVFDPVAIGRVLRILVINALQFSSEGDTVTVAVSRRGYPGRVAEFVVSVQDSGIGIRPEDRPRIFEKFFRAKNAVAKAPNGAGIALYIAKRIVEFHGGRMWAESAGLGAGATFFFALPERRVEQKVEARGREKAEAASGTGAGARDGAPLPARPKTPSVSKAPAPPSSSTPPIPEKPSANPPAWPKPLRRGEGPPRFQPGVSPTDPHDPLLGI